MWKPLKKILTKIQRWARNRSLIRVAREARAICQRTGRTMIIYFYEGEWRYIAKQDAKKMGLSADEIKKITYGKIIRYERQRKKIIS